MDTRSAAEGSTADGSPELSLFGPGAVLGQYFAGFPKADVSLEVIGSSGREAADETG